MQHAAYVVNHMNYCIAHQCRRKSPARMAAILQTSAAETFWPRLSKSLPPGTETARSLRARMSQRCSAARLMMPHRSHTFGGPSLTYKIIFKKGSVPLGVLTSGRAGCSCVLVESIFQDQLDPKRHATVSVENELPGSHCSRRAGEACRSEGLCNNDSDCKIPQKHAPDRDESVDGQKGSI
jgi:hypothetical protein